MQALAAQALCRYDYHLATLLSVQLQSAIAPTDLQFVRTSVTAVGIKNYDQELIVQHSNSQCPVLIIEISEYVGNIRLNHLLKALEETHLQPSDMSNHEGMPPVGEGDVHCSNISIVVKYADSDPLHSKPVIKAPASAH